MPDDPEPLDPPEPPLTLVEQAVEIAILKMLDDVDRVYDWVGVPAPCQPAADPRAEAWRAIRAAQERSGITGSFAALGDFLGFPGAAAGMVADSTTMAKSAVQMAQRVYAAYGHNITSPTVKARMLGALGDAPVKGDSHLGREAVRMTRPIVERYIQRTLNQGVRAFVRMLLRAGVRKVAVVWMPIVGSAVNYFSNRDLMRQLGLRVLQDASQPPVEDPDCPEEAPGESPGPAPSPSTPAAPRPARRRSKRSPKPPPP